MRWNITQGHEALQQSSVIVSNTAKRSYNSFRTSQMETSASVLLDSDLLRVIPDNESHYAVSMERRYPLVVMSIINFLAHMFALARL